MWKTAGTLKLVPVCPAALSHGPSTSIRARPTMEEGSSVGRLSGQVMAPHNANRRDNRTPGTATLRPGHRIREIRQDLHDRHPARARYQVIAAQHSVAGGAPLVPPASDEYQIRLYTRSRSGDVRVRLAAVREAIATSPYVWEDLADDGVREWVEPSIEDDVLLSAALVSLGTLSAEERPYLGKFVVEEIYEILTSAEAEYWHRAVSGRRRH